MNKPTCEQLIEALGDNIDITICSDIVYGLGFEYQQLKNELEEKDKEIDRLNNIIDELVLSCYGSDMSLAEFENIWEIAFNKKYNPKEIDKLKELKEGR